MDYEALADELGIPLGKIFKIKHLYFIITKEGLFVGYNFQDVERKLSSPEEEMIIEGIKHCIEEKEDGVKIEYPSTTHKVKGADRDIATYEIFTGKDPLGEVAYYYFDGRGRMQKVWFNAGIQGWDSNVVPKPSSITYLVPDESDITFVGYSNWVDWFKVVATQTYPYTYYVIYTLQKDEYVHYEIRKKTFKNTLTDFSLVDYPFWSTKTAYYPSYDEALAAMVQLYTEVEQEGKWVL